MNAGPSPGQAEYIRDWIRKSMKTLPHLRWRWDSELDAGVGGFRSRQAAAEDGVRHATDYFCVRLDSPCWYIGTPRYLYRKNGVIFCVSWNPFGTFWLPNEDPNDP